MSVINKLALVAMVALLAVACTYAHADEEPQNLLDDLQGEIFPSAFSESGVVTQQRSLLATTVKAPVYPTPPKVCYNKSTRKDNTYFIYVRSRTNWGFVRDQFRIALTNIYIGYGSKLRPQFYGRPGQRRTMPKGSITTWELVIVVPVDECARFKEGMRNALRNRIKRFAQLPGIISTRLSWFI